MNYDALFGFIGAVVGGFATYVGTVQGLKGQEKALQVQKEEQKKQSLDVIDTFIMDELMNNVKEVESRVIKLSDLIGSTYENMLKMNVGKMTYNLSYKEYDTVKYELVKLSGIKASAVVGYYKMFRIIEHCSFKSLTLSEFNFIKLKYKALNKQISEYKQKFNESYKEIKK